MSDQKTNLLLVGEVEKRPILYNFKLSDYSKKHETEKAWAEVGYVVKLTAAECKERWKIIRAVFVRHLKPPQSGSGTKEKKAYYLSDALQFTVPYIKALGKPSGNLSQPPPEEEEGPALWDGGNDDDDLLSETPLPSPFSPPPPASSSSSVTSTLPQHQDHQSEAIKQHILNKKKRPAKYGDVDKAFMKYLDRKMASSSAKREELATEPREESLKMFLLSFLPDLVKMEDWEVRQFKRKTLDAVDGIMSARSTTRTSARPPSSSCPSLSNDSSFSDQIAPPTTSTLEGYNINEGSPLAAYYSPVFQQNTEHVID